MAKHAHIGEIVAEFGLSADTWRRLADRGAVRAVRVNGQRVFDRESVAEYLEHGDEPLPQAETDILKRSRQRLLEKYGCL